MIQVVYLCFKKKMDIHMELDFVYVSRQLYLSYKVGREAISCVSNSTERQYYLHMQQTLHYQVLNCTQCSWMPVGIPFPPPHHQEVDLKQLHHRRSPWGAE